MWIFAVAAAAGCLGCTPQHVAAGDVLARAPYLGVSCRAPNSIACDRVGLAVWLRRPARRVDAHIGGRRLTLDDPAWSGRASGGGRTHFAGFLARAGMTSRTGPLAVRRRAGGRWMGAPPVVARVRLSVTGVDGRIVVTALPVSLSAGWG